MPTDPILFAIFLIFAGAAVLAGAALYARQSMLVAYIVLGGLLGPWGFKLVSDPEVIRQIGHVGIIFLLYLLGLNLHPQKLGAMLREALSVTLVSCALFGLLGTGIARAFGFGIVEAGLIGAATMFSSTIIGLKLLPTTELHHRHMGEAIISVLLLQDMLAIVILLVLGAFGRSGIQWQDAGLLILALPGLAGFAYLGERYVLMRLILRFDTIQEYVFLLAIGWCLGVAQLAHTIGLSYEIGAFVAGVALATSPVARFIAESLKPLRDFFLIMFFFSLGAGFALPALPAVALPAVVLAAAMLAAKPLVFRQLLITAGETPAFALQTGVRLGQVSEFALLIAVLAAQSGVLSERAAYLIQAATLISFIVSSYLIVLLYPTPIAVNSRLRRS